MTKKGKKILKEKKEIIKAMNYVAGKIGANTDIALITRFCSSVIELNEKIALPIISEYEYTEVFMNDINIYREILGVLNKIWNKIPDDKLEELNELVGPSVLQLQNFTSKYHYYQILETMLKMDIRVNDKVKSEIEDLFTYVDKSLKNLDDIKKYRNQYIIDFDGLESRINTYHKILANNHNLPKELPPSDVYLKMASMIGFF